MPGRHIPPDYSKGDESTIGGYMAVHDRPAAFEGSDGMSYSVALEVDETGEPGRPFGAYILFVRWRRVGQSGVEGHLESEFLSHGPTRDAAIESVSKMSIADVKETLERLLTAQRAVAGTPRRWWDAMRAEDDR